MVEPSKTGTRASKNQTDSYSLEGTGTPSLTKQQSGEAHFEMSAVVDNKHDSYEVDMMASCADIH